MYKKESFVLQMRRTAAAAATFVAATLPWAQDDLVTIQGVSVVNADSNNKDWDIGVKRYETDVYFTTVDAPNAGLWTYTELNVTIPSEYKVIIRFISPAAGDRFTVNIFGYIERWYDTRQDDA